MKPQQIIKIGVYFTLIGSLVGAIGYLYRQLAKDRGRALKNRKGQWRELDI